MTEPTATASGPNAPKRRGRPPKNQRVEATPVADDKDLEIERLRMELAIAKGAPTVTAPQGPKPGEYIVVGKDRLGTEEIRKRPWTRGEIDATYPKVTFTPRFSVPVTVNGHTWNLVANVDATVPSVVKDRYDYSMSLQHQDMAARYPEPSMDQISRINARARATGQKQWSPLHFLGVGEVIPEVEVRDE